MYGVCYMYSLFMQAVAIGVLSQSVIFFSVFVSLCVVEVNKTDGMSMSFFSPSLHACFCQFIISGLVLYKVVLSFSYLSFLSLHPMEFLQLWHKRPLGKKSKI